jgi:membrane-bound lytic murein transglycosylase D
MKYVVLSVAALFLLAAPVWAAEVDIGVRRPQTAEKLQNTEKRISDLERDVASLRRELGYLKMPIVPDQISLCGSPIPLTNEDVREDFEREFYQFLENKGLLTILIKRYGKFFSVVSGELQRTNMPSDLIYLALVESYLNPRASSKANAGGIWQFIRDTGKREGLSITDQIDERYSVTRSTKSALVYLRKLRDEFGDWLVAMAAYNAGEGRLREAIANQNSRDFFQLFLPEETDRYIFRIAAMKEIVENPQKYGLPIEKSDYYRPYAVTEITLDVEKETHTAVLAQAMDLPYKIFREYNLHIRKYRLPRGTYHLYVPVEKKETFLRGIKICPTVTVQP